MMGRRRGQSFGNDLADFSSVQVKSPRQRSRYATLIKLCSGPESGIWSRLRLSSRKAEHPANIVRVGDDILLPYGVADNSVAFAFIPVAELLARM